MSLQCDNLSGELQDQWSSSCHCHYLQSSNCPWLVCLLYLGSVGSSKGFCRPFVVAITCHLLYILAYQSLVAYCITQYQYFYVLVIWRYSCNKYIIVIFTSTRQNVPSDILTFTFRSVKIAENHVIYVLETTL